MGRVLMALFTNKFYPNFISGLQLWLDASDSTTLFQDSAATTPALALVENYLYNRWGII